MPKPTWLRAKVDTSEAGREVEAIVRSLSLHTVCDEAGCPNRMECYGRGTATFLILGDICTRSCAFCQVAKGRPPLPPDLGEAERLAEAVSRMGLKHVVVTSVTRDDLHDGGAEQFAETIMAIRRLCVDAAPLVNGGRQIGIEVLVPDFLGSEEALAKVVVAGPDVLNHNVETVPRLYSAVRPQADYRRSIGLIARARELAERIGSRVRLKSGIMLGLGEREDEVLAVFADLCQSGCELLTIGQYLAPSKAHYPVAEYLSPERFEAYGEKARAMGFIHVASFPLARSSYRAGEALAFTR